MLGMARDSGMAIMRPASSRASASARSLRTSIGNASSSRRQAETMMITCECLINETRGPVTGGRARAGGSGPSQGRLRHPSSRVSCSGWRTLPEEAVTSRSDDAIPFSTPASSQGSRPTEGPSTARAMTCVICGPPLPEFGYLRRAQCPLARLPDESAALADPRAAAASPLPASFSPSPIAPPHPALPLSLTHLGQPSLRRRGDGIP